MNCPRWRDRCSGGRDRGSSGPWVRGSPVNAAIGRHFVDVSTRFIWRPPAVSCQRVTVTRTRCLIFRPSGSFNGRQSATNRTVISISIFFFFFFFFLFHQSFLFFFFFIFYLVSLSQTISTAVNHLFCRFVSLSVRFSVVE